MKVIDQNEEGADDVRDIGVVEQIIRGGIILAIILGVFAVVTFA